MYLAEYDRQPSNSIKDGDLSSGTSAVSENVKMEYAFEYEALETNIGTSAAVDNERR